MSQSTDVPAPRIGRPFLQEMMIIVVSILIAFGLDASWDGWRRASDLAADRSALREEFTRNRVIVDGGLERHTSIQARLNTLLAAVAETPRGTSVTVPDTVLGAMFEWRTQDWTTGTLHSFLASDGLQQLDDPELRSWIGRWPAIIQDVDEDQELGRDYVNAVVIGSMSERFPVAHLVAPWAKTVETSTQLRVDDALHALIATRAAHQTLIVRSLWTFRAKIDSVLVHF